MFGGISTTETDLQKLRHSASQPFSLLALDCLIPWNSLADSLSPTSHLFTIHMPLLSQFPKEYPAKPPHVRFISQIRHPNIFDSGDICLDILKDKWSPSLSVAQVLLGIQSLLDNPNVYDPTDYQLAQMYQKNREEYNKIVKVYVQKNLRE